MKKARLWMVVSGVLLSVFLLFGGIAGAEEGVTDTEIRIGSTMDLSGPLAFMGQSWRDGANMYFKHINETGGIHGRKIKFLLEDDGFQSPRTVQAAKKLVTKDNVFCMSMNMGAAGIFAILPFLEEHKVPMLPAGTANEMLTNPPRKYVFLVDTSYITAAVLAVRHMKDTWKVAKPVGAVIYQDDVTGQQWLKGAQSGFEKVYGLKNVLALSYKRGATDFSSQIAQCKQAGVTHVFVHGNVREPASILKEAQRIQYKAAYVCSSAVASRKVVELAGDSIDYSNGLYMSTYARDVIEESNPGITLFKDLTVKYKMCSADNLMNLWAFHSAWVLGEVLKRTGRDLTREKFIKAAETLKGFDTGLMTPITWRPDKRGGGDAVRIFKADPVKIHWRVDSEWIYE